jgi:hypothetical protein
MTLSSQLGVLIVDHSWTSALAGVMPIPAPSEKARAAASPKPNILAILLVFIDFYSPRLVGSYLHNYRNKTTISSCEDKVIIFVYLNYRFAALPFRVMIWHHLLLT